MDLQMTDCDVVYIIKNDPTGAELMYSLRSVDQNFPCRKLWIYGGKPRNIEPDEYVPYEQKGSTKWEKVCDTLKQICKNSEVSQNFWLFNDDFFVLKPIEKPFVYYAGTLQDRIDYIETKSRARTLYTIQMRNLVDILELSGCPTLNYAVHIPILIDKDMGLEVLENYPTCPMFRGLYGNYWEIGGKEIPADVKIVGTSIKIPSDWEFCSTLDASFGRGKAGITLREKFSKKSRWER